MWAEAVGKTTIQPTLRWSEGSPHFIIMEKKKQLGYIISQKNKWKKIMSNVRGLVKCMKCHKFICLWEGHTIKWEICEDCQAHIL